MISKRPRPRQRIRQVAEAFAEIEAGRDRREVIGAQRLHPPGMTPADTEIGKPDRLVRRVDEELVLQPGVQRTEPGNRVDAGHFQALPLVRDRKTEIRRDALRQVGLDIEFAGAIRTG